jgi:hypothetical protein
VSFRTAVVVSFVVLAGAVAVAQEAPAPLDACAMLPEVEALALLPGTKQVTRQPTTARSADRESSACDYRDAADPLRAVTLSMQRFAASVPSSIGWALFNDNELESVDGIARGALWKPSTATMMLVLKREFITLTVTRPDAPPTMEQVRAAMKQVYERLGATAGSATAP